MRFKFTILGKAVVLFADEGQCGERMDSDEAMVYLDSVESVAIEPYLLASWFLLYVTLCVTPVFIVLFNFV